MRASIATDGAGAIVKRLEEADLARVLGRDEYQDLFRPLQERLRHLQYELMEAEIPTIIVFEGWDFAGKGAVIQRLTGRLDPRAFRVYPATPPSELEQRYHWLRRHQVRLPPDGHMAVFDESWYRQVLQDRVEKRKKKRCRRAYDQINQFERWLTDDGQVLVKLFFHISKREQRQRLIETEADPMDSWKVGADDWKRHRHYAEWYEAIDEMLERTDTEHGPWTVVSATDPRWTRMQVFAALVQRMEGALARRQSHPEEVSRTEWAREATRDERKRRGEKERALFQSVAEAAGLPLNGSS